MKALLKTLSNKKQLFVGAMLMLLSTLVYAQSNRINYKAIIKDSGGNIMTNQNIFMQLSVIQGTTSTIYTEVHAPTTDANGMVILNIGEGSSTSGSYDTIDWSLNDHYLNVQVDTGSGFVDLGTTQFHAVPYALNAANVTGLETIDEGNGVGWRLKGQDPLNYGNIGENAVDLSRQASASSVSGASGINSVALGSNSSASGNNSTAMGSGGEALGNKSTVIGVSCLASGDISFAIGNRAMASASGSIAIGTVTTASGNNSIAIGENVRARSYGETAIGLQNATYSPISTTSWHSLDRLFVIGNGFSSGSNALTILKNGTITAPSFDLSEITDDKALITKEYFEANDNNSVSTGLEAIDEGNGIGWRLKDVNASNYEIIGDQAADLSRFINISLGATGASGSYATALGFHSEASGNFSTAMGLSTIAPSFGETVIGRMNSLYTPNSAIAWSPTDRLFVIGNGNVSTNRKNALTVLKNGKIGIGEDNPSGFLEVAAANSATQPNINLVHNGGSGARINFSNTDTTNGNVWTLYGDTDNTTSNSTFNLFHSVIGNVIIVKGNGNVGIRRTPSTNDLEVNGTASKSSSGSWLANSDRRLKKDIITIAGTSALNKINQLRGVTYQWNDTQTGIDRPEGIQYGFIAQELMQVFPEKVTKDAQGFYQTAYGDYDALFVQAFKELSSKVETLENENTTLKNKLHLLEDLEARLSSLEENSSIQNTESDTKKD